MKYVALLRGINVGGNNKVDMKQLKLVFEQLGLTAVKTYINSGNVIFSDGHLSRAKLTTKLEQAIQHYFGFKVKVLLRDQTDMENVITRLPTTWVNDVRMKCDVMFLWDSLDSAHLKDQLPIKPGLDDVIILPGALIWRIDRPQITKSGLLKIVGTPLYKQMTIRNSNTVRKIWHLMSE